jgi:hypothetical protein
VDQVSEPEPFSLTGFHNLFQTTQQDDCNWPTDGNKTYRAISQWNETYDFTNLVIPTGAEKVLPYLLKLLPPAFNAQWRQSTQTIVDQKGCDQILETIHTSSKNSPKLVHTCDQVSSTWAFIPTLETFHRTLAFDRHCTNAGLARSLIKSVATGVNLV